MTWALYASLTLYWAPTPSMELEGGPALYQDVGEHYAEVEPLTLTWSPEEGFGASSSMHFGRF